jgi:hypothetical protein
VDVAGGRPGLGGAEPDAKLIFSPTVRHRHGLDAVGDRLPRAAPPYCSTRTRFEEPTRQGAVFLQFVDEQHPAGRHHVMIGRRNLPEIAHRLGEEAAAVGWPASM